MTQSMIDLAVDSPADTGLAALLDELTDRLHAGEAVDLEAIIGLHPDHAGPLRQLLPALEMMGELKRSAARDVGSIAPPDQDPRLETSVLGDFRIVREVGRGGMGVVYEAQQLSLDRRVALKVLPIAAAMDGKQLQRFQLEAHAAACLHHTNIVPVHAVGCERGVPFYAMQFIDGRSLADLINELRRVEGHDAAELPGRNLADMRTSTLTAKLLGGRIGSGVGAPAQGCSADREPAPAHNPAPAVADARARTRPSTPQPLGESSTYSTHHRAYVQSVAQLGVQVAEALDHAHTRGILHRDIKPANLLLDDQGQLWVTDFGLAQIQGNLALTLTGDVLGTLRYMSPEQALAKRVVVDGRTDIYSLGVTLYELLTLRPAVEGTDRAEILRRIAQEEPVSPRKLNPAVPRDLETILLKAMAKEPNARYATVKELADELRRFLDHKPIRARRANLFDRSAKWARRHRPLVSSVGIAAVLFLSLAVLVLSSSNLRIQQEKRRADQQTQRAEANLRKARDVVDRMFTHVADVLAHTPRMEKVRHALLVDALEFYQRFLKENRSDTGLKHETALAYIKLADIHNVFGRYAEGQEARRSAIALLQDLSSAFPQVPEYRDNLAYCFGELGRERLKKFGHQEGIAEWLKEIEIRERLAFDFPTIPEYRRRLALAHAEAGNGYALLEMAVEAESQYRQALRHCELLRAEFPEVPEDGHCSARILHGWGEFLRTTNRLPEAEEELRKALTLGEALLAQDPGNDEFRSLLSRTQGEFGQVLLQRGKTAEAESLFIQSIHLYESLIRDFPDTPLHRRRLCVVYQYLSQTLMQMRRIDEACSALRHAIELREKLAAERYDPDDRPVWGGDLYQALGANLLEAGREQEASEAYRLACVHFERVIAEHPDIAWPKIEYAELLNNCSAIQFRDAARASVLARQALRLAPRSREGWKMLGLAEYRAGHWAASVEALDHWAQLDPHGDPVFGLVFAIAHGRLGHTREARDWYDRAVGWMDQRGLQSDGLRRLRAEAEGVLGVPLEPSSPAEKKEPRLAEG
jgi:serine/threonine protein kinase